MPSCYDFCWMITEELNARRKPLSIMSCVSIGSIGRSNFSDELIDGQSQLAGHIFYSYALTAASDRDWDVVFAGHFCAILLYTVRSWYMWYIKRHVEMGDVCNIVKREFLSQVMRTPLIRRLGLERLNCFINRLTGEFEDLKLLRFDWLSLKKYLKSLVLKVLVTDVTMCDHVRR